MTRANFELLWFMKNCYSRDSLVLLHPACTALSTPHKKLYIVAHQEYKQPENTNTVKSQQSVRIVRSVNKATMKGGCTWLVPAWAKSLSLRPDPPAPSLEEFLELCRKTLGRQYSPWSATYIILDNSYLTGEHQQLWRTKSWTQKRSYLSTQWVKYENDYKTIFIKLMTPSWLCMWMFYTSSFTNLLSMTLSTQLITNCWYMKQLVLLKDMLMLSQKASSTLQLC